jgi:hypothetical protein
MVVVEGAPVDMKEGIENALGLMIVLVEVGLPMMMIVIRCISISFKRTNAMFL